jgi:hypothetical protein
MTIIEYKPWYSTMVVDPSFEDYGGTLDGWTITPINGGPDNPPYDNSNPYDVETPYGDHFAGRITSWGTSDFRFSQLIEVSEHDPAEDEVHWQLSAYVQLHSRTGGTAYPTNVHQVWEIGWNNNTVIPPSPDRCDNYQTIPTIDGTFTGNDPNGFHLLTANGSITGVAGLKYVALRVRMYNDAPREWSMMNIDNVDFEATMLPPSPAIQLSTDTLTPAAWIGSSPANDSFTVRNVGVGTLNYQITDDVGWLSVSPDDGASTGEADTITVMYSTDALPGGTHNATITVSDPNAWNDPQTIDVTLLIESVGPDFDGDGDVDLRDYGHLQTCYTGQGNAQKATECLDARLDEDEDVDPDDFSIFQGCMTAADVPANPNCEP